LHFDPLNALRSDFRTIALNSAKRRQSQSRTTSSARERGPARRIARAAAKAIGHDGAPAEHARAAHERGYIEFAAR